MTHDFTQVTMQPSTKQFSKSKQASQAVLAAASVVSYAMCWSYRYAKKLTATSIFTIFDYFNYQTQLTTAIMVIVVMVHNTSWRATLVV